MKIALKIFNYFIVSLTVLAMIVSVGLMGPKLFGLNPYIATSGSMSPTVPTGAIVYVDTRNTDVKVNDIIMFKIPSVSKGKIKTVTHRVIGIENGGYITKGDANEERDASIVEKNQVIGKYSYHIPNIGYIYDAIGYKGIIVIAIWIAIMNILSILFLYIYGLKEKEKLERGAESDKDMQEGQETEGDVPTASEKEDEEAVSEEDNTM